MQPLAQSDEAQAINQDWLDKLVLTYLQQQTELQAESSCSARLLTGCEKVRQLVENGRIREALSISEHIHPAPTKDLRLVFQLKRQQLVELLRQAPSQDGCASLTFIRQELAPLALEAYDTSYAEFRKCLLLLVYPKDAAFGPVQQEWDPASRTRLASVLCRTLRQAAGVQPCKLALLIRYLSRMMMLLKRFDAPEAAGNDPAVLKAASRLDTRARDCAPLPCASRERFPEDLVQYLREAAGITRQEAVDSLRHTDGNMNQALDNELSSWHIDIPYLDQLVEDYANCRGLTKQSSKAGEHVRSAIPLGGPDAGKLKQPFPPEANTWDGSASSNGPTVALNTPVMSAEPDLDAVYMHSEQRSPGSSNGDHNQESRQSTAYSRSASQSPPHKALRSHNGASPHAGMLSHAEQPYQQASTDFGRYQRLAMLLTRVRTCCETGSAEQVEAAVVAELGPSFLESNPEVAFQLQRCQFGQLVQDGHTEQALRLLRHSMAPIALSLQHLQPCLKAATACLLPHSALQHQFEGIPPAPKALQQSLEAALDLPEPMLMRVLRLLLHCHARWLKVQRCSDRFEEHLGICQLRGSRAEAVPCRRPRPPTPTGMVGDDMLQSAAVAAPGGDADYEGAQSMDEGEDSPAAEGVPEGPILLLMEWSGLPRNMAIDLLAAHGNDPNAVLADLYN
ncbi:hypothetical protein WJX74_007735 [Apatococcus lobatus]|uniref:CTLH domain-containing protein n=1 Tax=Apatococcus lobatus TaxID=904363 RepID=A0AAW1QUZ3_9CHLO